MPMNAGGGQKFQYKQPDAAIAERQSLRQMRQSITVWLYRAAGAGIAIGMMEAFAHLSNQPLTLVPFVTSIVLTLILPDSEAAQPYAVIVGHLLSTLAGFAAMWCLGANETASAVGVGVAALLMLAMGAVHPPAGIDAFLVPLLGLPVGWTINPILVGAVLLVVFSQLWARAEGLLLRRPAPRG
jgi:CBS-domain-containing membrane protein